MKYLSVFFILTATTLMLANCSSSSNDLSGANKFLGKWKEVRDHAAKTAIITKEKGNSFNIVIPKRPEVRNDGIQHYTFKYDAGKDVLYKGADHKMEIRYNKDSGTIQAFINQRPGSRIMKKIQNIN